MFQFPRLARALGVGFNPLLDFPVFLARCQFLQQCIGIKFEKTDKVFVYGSQVFVFAVFPCERRPTLVEHARKNHKTSKPNAETTRRMLSEVGNRNRSTRSSITHKYTFLLTTHFYLPVDGLFVAEG